MNETEKFITIRNLVFALATRINPFTDARLMRTHAIAPRRMEEAVADKHSRVN